VSFFFNAHNDFLEEIAKFRAARRLWARIMRDRFHATSARAMQLRFHTQTAGSTLTAQQPDNNIVRVALQAMAAVLGGTQSLHCNGRDEALALPTEESARIALRTQQVIAAETGVVNTVDPVAGSYTIESLTNRLEREAESLLERIDHAGGTLAAIETGLIQREIQDSAYRAQLAIDKGESVVVGVNRFAHADSENQSAIRPSTSSGRPEALEGRNPQSAIFAIDPDIERRQIERVRAVRAGRSDAAVQSALERVRAAARDGSNVVPPIVAAVEAMATLGDIATAMRDVFGEYTETATV
jgi:methylmalonyl-CoA mutase N-terminal domain/subunit